MAEHKKRRRHHKPKRFEGLPDDAVVGSNPDLLALIQSLKDEGESGVRVAGYAVGPNPSVDGDYLGEDTKKILYYWFEGDGDTLEYASADYAFKRLFAGEMTWA